MVMGEVSGGGEVCWLSGRCKKVLEGETVDRKCDSHRRDVKGIKEVCQLTERCDGYEEGVRRCWKV